VQGAPQVPDLLDVDPTLRVDRREMRDAIVFAFAAGEGGMAIDRLIAEAAPCSSSFDPSRFEAGLFLEDVVKRSFPVAVSGHTANPDTAYLVRTIAHPPRDPSCVAFRRGILEELVAKPQLVADLEETYRDVRALRDRMTTPAHGSFLEQHQHRVETLRALRAVIAGLASRFEGAASGLSRMRVFGQSLEREDAFGELTSLLDYEDGLATVDVRLRVGSDGSIRGFSMIEAREQRESPFYKSPVGRFVTRVFLWFRGYRFGEAELLSRALDQVFTPFEHRIVEMMQLGADIEVYLGCLGFRDLALQRGLAVCLPEIAKDGPRRFVGLYNPLLFRSRGAPKPCDIESRAADVIVMITGPNSGGKTRLLQAIGIAQLLAQGGFFVPAREARLHWTEGLFLSLFQEVTSGQSEGRLGTELARIRELFEEVAPGDLALIDELCSGTNPSEAEALIRLVLELLHELRPQVFVTTHFLSFAAELAENPPAQGMEFLQAAIDVRSRPTYAFLPGVAKTSLAAETAARLGVTLEELVALVARKRASSGPEVELPAELGTSEAFEPKRE
jgi:DNA mismatch repair protein MutS2